MARDKEWYIDEAQDLLDTYLLLRRDQMKIDDIANLEWRLPKALEEIGRRAVKTTAPADAIKAGARVLTVLDEIIEVDPVTVMPKDPESKAAREKANQWEDVLKWQLELASRRKSILKEDITRSALMYDEVCAQVIHLPSQIKNVKSLGGNPARLEAAQQYGQFAISLKNPQSVYTRYSEYGPEAVLYATVQRPRQIVDFWGNRAGKLKKLVEKKQADDWYILFDYVDFERRFVWAIPGETVKASGHEDRIDILYEEQTLPFLPWVCVIGGSNLNRLPEKQRYPLLWSTMKAGLVDTANIIGSLMLNEVIATASQPRLAKIGPTPDSIKIDYTDPTGEIDVPPGHTVEALQQSPISPALRELYDRTVNDLQGNTIPRILVTAEAAPGEPFSGYNLRIQQAIASLMPWKRVSERAIAGIERQKLLWCHYSGEPIEGPKGYKINPSEIDPQHIYLSVELTPYEPLDEQQKINSAVMAARELKLPTEDIMGMMNISDPEKKIRKWAKEQMSFAQLQGELQKIQMTASGEIEQMAAQMAQGMLQQMQEQGQGPSAQQRERQPMQGMEAVGGPGFNPAAGGQAPAGANPAGNVREQQTGLSRLGEGLF